MVKPWTEWVVSTRVKVSHRSYGLLTTIAENWQSGRVLCIGDATHRHPPINGLGSNTCISDAFNLAWKLAYVIKGWSSSSLLDTLTIERKLVGDAIVRRANDGMEAHRRLWKIIGLDHNSRKTFSGLLGADSKEGAEMRDRYREALEATELEIQALIIHVNQIYLDSKAIVVEIGDEAPNSPNLEPLRDVKVSTYPGYHLPHVWLVTNGRSRRVSNLVLCGQGRFALLTGIGGDGWIRAIESILGPDGASARAYKIAYCDYIECYREEYPVRGMDENGAILVRPDHFVAWRCQNLVKNRVRKLSSVFDQILGQQERCS
ncbi:hypothetical protein P171DRAFT_354080 [Karstenula rhodostoma CBS 690.94]|uniref:FAD-binding domain-containing protein n=1 Tax=Karstenula rhodostoma CBS 690.94 TaxID=1392251 RepID=A0A9P4PRK6_9PLEO|nr:hypothetical protein P171DRAFT_354080 [Karstenula rhodostoma CBS 690.94]